MLWDKTQTHHTNLLETKARKKPLVKGSSGAGLQKYQWKWEWSQSKWLETLDEVTLPVRQRVFPNYERENTKIISM
jgi:hypothetical protein